MQLLFYTLVLPFLLAIYALSFRKSVDAARRPFADAIVIAATCGIMAWAVVPVEQKVKLGRDLRGGVSLVYSVTMPEGIDDETKGELLKETIKTLKNRVNPQGVLDLTMTPQGQDRIEVVMPLPGEEVRTLGKAYREAVDALLAKARLTPRELDAALAAGTAAELAKGDAARAARLAALQSAYAAAREARARFDGARGMNMQGAELDRLADDAAAAELAYDSARSAIQTGALGASRFGRIMAMPSVAGKDGSSERSAALEALRLEFPAASKEIDAAVTAYDAYAGLRTVLDDPDDLKRLLKGAGVLDFRIAVTTSNSMGVNVDELRTQLAEGGALAAESPVARWFRINQLSEWYRTPEELAALEANPASYFASTRGLVAGAGPDKQVYLLLWTTPDRSLTHEPGGREWAMKQVFRSNDELGRPAVSFMLDEVGGIEMGRLTGANVNQPMAIVLDNQVYSAPNLNSKINGNGQISGNFSDADLDYLVRVLGSGSLGARLSPEPVSVSVLGPAMGKDNLERGFDSMMLSVAVTFVVMIVYYFVPGIIANLSLVANALAIFFCMVLVDANFTLPGLAGVALSIAIAVDSNVLIYERLREELVDKGERLKDAIETAMGRAASAIIDGNITNLIVVVVLYWFAGAEVKGFALVMGIGVFTTLAAGLVVTHVLLRCWQQATGASSVAMLPTAVPAIPRLLRPSVDWLRYRHVLWAASLVFAVACVAATVSRGNDIFETEFRGGTTMTMSTRAARDGEPAVDGRMALPRATVEERVRAVGLANAQDPVLSELRNATVLTVGEPSATGAATSFQIKVPNPIGIDDEAQVAEKLVAGVVGAFEQDMDIRRPVTFAGIGERTAGNRAYRIDKPNLGDVLSRAGLDVPVDEAMGGVVVVIEGIDPPIALSDAAERIRRLRSQPDFSEVAGRSVDVVGLAPAGEGSYGAIAVVVGDPDLAGRRIADAVWQRNWADLEWNLASTALGRRATLEQVSSISPSVARDLAEQAVWAVLLSLVGMLIYIWIRFGSLLYSVATVVGVVFNMAVCLGLLAMSPMLGDTGIGQALRIQDFRIDLNVVSALLVVIGYSLNDTIVILDRIRENRGKLPFATRSIINDSINQTFSRTVLTGGCAAATPIILYFMGGSSIQPFAYTFFVGLVAGTFSSVAIAAPLVFVTGDGAGEPAARPASGPAEPAPA
jgi:SecD/SecF fusion protein